MRSCRVTLTWLAILAAVVLSVPALAIASGPSAGDNQYTDPLAGQGNHNSSGGQGNHNSSGGQGNSSSSGGSQTPPGSTSQTASSSSGTPSTSLSSSSPSSSTASSTATGTTAASSSRTLPLTGFDAGLAAAIGFSLIGIGLVTRRRILCSDR